MTHLRSSPTRASSEYPNTPEQQNYDFKSHLMKMIEALKEEINKPFKEIQENTNKERPLKRKQIKKYRET